MGVPELPIEIIESIIDAVGPNADWTGTGSEEISILHTALNACALTCRTWLPRSRFNIFKVVVVHSQQNFDALWSSLQANRTNGSYVGLLTIRGEDNPNTASKLAPIEYAWIGKACALLPPLLTNLRTFALAGAIFHTADPHLFRGLSQLKSPIKLHLIEVPFPSFSHFTRLVSLFPNLSRLYIYDISWDSTSHWRHLSSPVRSKRVKISELFIQTNRKNAIHIKDIIDWIADGGSQNTLHTMFLTDTWHKTADAAVFSKLWVSCGSTMRNLAWPIDIVSDCEIRLYPCTNLQWLVLSISVSFTETLTELHEVILSIGSKKLEEVLFLLSEGDMEPFNPQFKEDDWKALDEALTSSQFPALREVAFVTDLPDDDSPPPPPLDLEALYAKFPKLHRKGILRGRRDSENVVIRWMDPY